MQLRFFQYLKQCRQTAGDVTCCLEQNICLHKKGFRIDSGKIRGPMPGEYRILFARVNQTEYRRYLQ